MSATTENIAGDEDGNRHAQDRPRSGLQIDPGDTPEQSAPKRRGRISQRLLIFHRWIAIIGQCIALLLVEYGLSYDLPLLPALILIAASIALNLLVIAQPRRPNQADDRTATVYLSFDILQLSALLYLTGGLQNPFAVLMLAPVTVAATMLGRQSVLIIVGLAIACLSALAVAYRPLPGPEGISWVMPPVYLAGFWTALALACFFISAYVYMIEREARRMSDALTATQMALIREQKVSALGALAAAAAHELGSPLSTIRLSAKEISKDIPKDSDLTEDIDLLISESDRCRTILTELSRTPEPASDNPFDTMPLPMIVEEIARIHIPGTISFAVEIDADFKVSTPSTYFGPEIQHGLGNILQNAGQFAGRKVTARLHWDTQSVTVTIHDDGPGFPPFLLDRLGEPYVSGRVQKGENMGLGVFIAQTLLEGLGADILFRNAPRGGAQVIIHWPRKAFEMRRPT